MHAPTNPPAPKLIPTDVLLLAYRSGIFPMADSREDDEVFWVEPRRRAVFPLDGFHCSRSLAKLLKQDRYRVTVDADFGAVIDACAQPRVEPDGSTSGTWISEAIAASYRKLHEQGHAHSVEVWAKTDVGEELVGGLYGVSLGSAFFGESMFSRRTNASKICLVYLVERLRERGFTLLDTQFTTEHLKTFGAVDIPKEAYGILLDKAMEGDTVRF